MIRILISAAAVIAAAALFVTGNMLLGTTLAIALAQSSLSAGAIGLILVQYAVGFVLGTIYGTRLIGRIGHIRAFAAFAAVTCTATLLHAVFFDAWLWGLLRLLSGACAAVMLVVLESWINHYATPATRGGLLGGYMVSYYLAGAFGQWLVSVGQADDFRPYSLAAALLVLASVPLTLTRGESPAAHEAKRLPLKRLFKYSPLGVAGSFAGGFSMSAFFSLAPVHASRSGFDASFIASYMAAAVLACMIFQRPFGYLGDRRDRSRVILAIGLAAAASALVIAAWGQHSPNTLIATTMLYTGLLASLYPSCLALANDQMPERNLVGVNSGLLLAYGIGQICGPLLVGQMMGLRGPTGLYLGVATMLLLFSWYASCRLTAGRPVPPAEQQAFVPTAASTPVIAELDPRSELQGDLDLQRPDKED